MKRLGKFTIESKNQELKIDYKTLHKGVNNLRDYIVKVGDENKILYVISKVCDHAGGKLILKNDKAVCPMHNWHLDLDTLRYNDSHVKKAEVAYSVKENDQLIIKGANRRLKNPFRPNKKGEVKIRWINHATVLIECNGVTLMTDPWLFGPAFLTGWWLPFHSPIESIDLLKKVDYVFISHNHPDHLHAETLAILDRNKPIIVPNFISSSAEIFLKKLKFENIIPCEFLDILELGKKFQISILKSGDFRDDSGIYICANGHELLLTVDSNYLNSHVLPQNMDFLMTSFAGGASGFPLCYENYTEEEKATIIKRNRNSIKSSVMNYMKVASPKYYMPYAGMFSEYAARDIYINERNVKNSIEEFEKIASQLNVKFIQPESSKVVIFKDGEMDINDFPNVEYLYKESPSFYISNFKKDYPYNVHKILEYLKNSQYTGKQILQIIPTEDSFTKCIGEIVFADFNLGVFKTISEDNLIREKEDYRVMQIKIRAEIIMCVVENYLPWEDMSIGFQIRASRHPNEYESDFWYHFTNKYIAKENFRYTSYCGSCSIIDQNPIWAKSDIQELVLTKNKRH